MMPRTKRLFFALGVFLIVGIAGMTGLAYSILSPESRLNRASALHCTLEWGRLDPLPSSAEPITIKTYGSMFTREFRISFGAPPEDIAAWLESSLGTREAAVTTPTPGVRHFQIAPGGGAEFAEVTVDDGLHHVTIHVYWS